MDSVNEEQFLTAAQAEAQAAAKRPSDSYVSAVDLEKKLAASKSTSTLLAERVKRANDEIQRLQSELSQPKSASNRVWELEEEVARVKSTNFLETDQISRLTTALEESASALDMAELLNTEKYDPVVIRSELTDYEHAKLLGALEASAVAQSEAQEALKRSMAENVDIHLSRNAALERELTALRAEKDAALARETICQAELDHLRQRRSASAAGAYTDLLAANESLQQQVAELEDALRKARNKGDQESGLVEPLLREIDGLKLKCEEFQSRHVSCLERHLDDATSYSCCQSNIVQEVSINRSNIRRKGTPVRRVFHRRFFVPPQQVATSRMRPNVQVVIENTPAATALGIAGMQGWLRFDRRSAQFLSTNETILVDWQPSEIFNPRRIEATKVAFNTSGGIVRLSVQYPKLAMKVEAELAVLI